MRIDEKEVERLAKVLWMAWGGTEATWQSIAKISYCKGIRAVVAEIRLPEPSSPEIREGYLDAGDDVWDSRSFRAGVAWLLEWQRNQVKPKLKYEVRKWKSSICQVWNIEEDKPLGTFGGTDAQCNAERICAFLNEQEAKR